MANITKRVNRKAAEHLGEETAEVALLCEMKGTWGVGMVPAVLATRTTKRVMESKTSDRLSEQGGLAATFPRSNAAVAITPTRLLAMPSNGWGFTTPTLVTDRRHVRVEVTGRRGVAQRVVFRFFDGSQVEVDVAPGQPLKQFADALGHA